MDWPPHPSVTDTANERRERLARQIANPDYDLELRDDREAVCVFPDWDRALIVTALRFHAEAVEEEELNERIARKLDDAIR